VSSTDYCIASSDPHPNTPRPTPPPTPSSPQGSLPYLDYVANGKSSLLLMALLSKVNVGVSHLLYAMYFAAIDGNPSSSFPLKACQGDCDDDDDVSGVVCGGCSVFSVFYFLIST
jgi:hypothetical protein